MGRSIEEQRKKKQKDLRTREKGGKVKRARKNEERVKKKKGERGRS